MRTNACAVCSQNRNMAATGGWLDRSSYMNFGNRVKNTNLENTNMDYCSRIFVWICILLLYPYKCNYFDFYFNWRNNIILLLQMITNNFYSYGPCFVIVIKPNTHTFNTINNKTSCNFKYINLSNYFLNICRLKSNANHINTADGRGAHLLPWWCRKSSDPHHSGPDHHLTLPKQRPAENLPSAHANPQVWIWLKNVNTPPTPEPMPMFPPSASIENYYTNTDDSCISSPCKVNEVVYEEISGIG